MNMSMTVNELFDFALSRRHYVAGSLAGGVAALTQHRLGWAARLRRG
ncbi:MAG: hypothetical protein R2867_24975 [Caldilineaceae bacterium]